MVERKNAFKIIKAFVIAFPILAIISILYSKTIFLMMSYETIYDHEPFYAESRLDGS